MYDQLPLRRDQQALRGGSNEMEQKMVNLKINDSPVTVPEGTTVLEAARNAGIKIPSLCYLKDVNEIGACRICVVEV